MTYSLIRALARQSFGGGGNKRIVIGAVAVAVLMPLLVFAYASTGKPAGFVNDFAGMLVPSEVEALQAKLSAFEKSTGNELAVVTVPDLGGDTVENFAVKLFEEWGIGKKGKDNGVLLLISRGNHEVKIEVGYGLEGALTDAQSYWIIQEVIVPAFRDGKFFAGIDGAVDKIIAAVGGEVIPSAEVSSGDRNNRINIDWFWLILFAPLWLASILGRSKSWWAGGVLGGIAGVVIGLLKGFLYTGVIAVGLLIPIGLLFDYVVSKNYGKFKSQGRMPPWWLGGAGFGGGSSSGSGFGGFGGSSSGGSGSSGSW